MVAMAAEGWQKRMLEEGSAPCSEVQGEEENIKMNGLNSPHKCVMCVKLESAKTLLTVSICV